MTRDEIIREALVACEDAARREGYVGRWEPAPADLEEVARLLSYAGLRLSMAAHPRKAFSRTELEQLGVARAYWHTWLATAP
jgi:hypothetical protein